MRFLQEIHREIVGVADRLLLSVFIGVMFAKEFADFREEVESALRNGNLKAGNLLRHLHYEVSSALKRLTHIFDALLRTGISRFGSFHGDGAGATRILSLQLVACFHYPFLSCYPANTPAGHGIRLTYTIHNHYLLAQFRIVGNRHVLAYVIDMLVNLVGNNHHVGIVL